jgi:hypothetical protein
VRPDLGAQITGVNVSVTGSYSSADASSPLESFPPARSTRPSVSDVAVWPDLGTAIVAVGVGTGASRRSPPAPSRPERTRTIVRAHQPPVDLVGPWAQAGAGVRDKGTGSTVRPRRVERNIGVATLDRARNDGLASPERFEPPTYR